MNFTVSSLSYFPGPAGATANRHFFLEALAWKVRYHSQMRKRQDTFHRGTCF